MTVISGINAHVDGISTLRSWKIRASNLAVPGAASDAPGAVQRIAGNKDWRGVYLAYGHTPVPWPGSAFSFAGDVDDNYGVSGTAIVDKITIECPVEEAKRIEQVVEFSANGGLDRGAAAATAGSSPSIVSAISRKVSLDGVDVTDVRGWKLVLTARNKPYASSDTAGQIMRTAGNIDGQYEYKVYEDNPSDLPTEGEVKIVRFYVTATTYWELKWGIMEEIDDWGGDLEGAENVGASIRGSYNAFYGTISGSIKNPAGETKWS